MSGDPLEREIMWRQYALHIDLYKFHLDVTLKYNMFYFAIASGVISYVFSTEPGSTGTVKWALLLPMFLSIFFACSFAFATYLVDARKADLESLRIKLGIDTVPNMTLLQVVTALLSVGHLLIAVALISVLVSDRFF